MTDLYMKQLESMVISEGKYINIDNAEGLY